MSEGKGKKKYIAYCGLYCGEFEKCEKLDFLKNGHGDAHLKNLRIIKKKGTDAFLSGKKYWYSVIKNGSR